MTTNNDKVTLAVLSTKLDALHDTTAEIKDDTKEIKEAQKDHDRRITRLEERTGTMAKLQAAFTLVASAIAGFVGSRN